MIPSAHQPAASDARHANALAWVCVAHASAVVLAFSWGFGGNAQWLRTPLMLLGSLAFPLPFLLFLRSCRPETSARSLLLLLLPLLGLNLLVGLSLLNPNHREFHAEGQITLVRITSTAGLPSCARPLETARALWMTNCVYLCGFNLLLWVRRRSQLRLLLSIVALNTAVLAVLGSLQKLEGSTGLYFGRVASTNSSFFATFIYHNHWGSFAVLSLCTGLGLMWHHARNASRDHRGFTQSPAFLFLVLALVIAVTPPLSSSRSCTAMTLLVLALAAVEGMRRLREAGVGRFARLAIPLSGALVALGAIVWLAAPVMRHRIADSVLQLGSMTSSGDIGSRATLYGDTLRMALDRPVFGWGKGAYGAVFHHYNSQYSWQGMHCMVFVDAHSDWLQCFAEIGVVGALLTALSALLPLWRLRRSVLDSRLSRWLLIGCGLILLYAWVEFPFGNPAVTLAWWMLFFTALRYPQAD